jgi:hypothetical protein
LDLPYTCLQIIESKIGRSLLQTGEIHGENGEVKVCGDVVGMRGELIVLRSRDVAQNREPTAKILETIVGHVTTGAWTLQKWNTSNWASRTTVCLVEDSSLQYQVQSQVRATERSRRWGRVGVSYPCHDLTNGSE